jgi:PAS domain S-box-containing protein
MITTNRILFNGKNVWLSAARDVSKEILFEKKLKESQQQLSLIFNKTVNSMILLKVEENEQLRILALNDSLANKFNFEKSQVEGKLIEEVFNLDLLQDVTSGYSKAIQSGEIVYFTTNNNSFREPKVLEFTVVPIKDEFKRVTKLLAISHDVTIQKKAEEDTKLSEEKYRMLFDNSPMPMWIYEAEGLRFLEVNKAAINHYGYSREEFLQMNLYDIRPPERMEQLRQLYATEVPDSFVVETVHRKKNGELIIVEVSANKIVYGNHEARLALLLDQTEKERARKEILNTTEELRQLTAHLQNIREQERKIVAREIHDELGQQLTALKMDLFWINKKLESGNEEKIKSKSRSALELVDTTINVVRKIATALRPSIIDDLGLAEAVQWQCREFAERTGIKTICAVNVSDIQILPPVSIAVFRILQESFTNITRHAEATEVTCSLYQDQNKLVLEVRDNGKGFNASKLKHRTLGLLGMKERAEILNGQCEITGEPGKGTLVYSKIPLI